MSYDFPTFWIDYEPAITWVLEMIILAGAFIAVAELYLLAKNWWNNKL